MTEKDYKNLLYKIGPLRRDLISDGYDNALSEIQTMFDKIQILKYASGESCWTWTIPQKWTLKKAYIMSKDKNILFDKILVLIVVKCYFN